MLSLARRANRFTRCCGEDIGQAISASIKERSQKWRPSFLENKYRLSNRRCSRGEEERAHTHTHRHTRAYTHTHRARAPLRGQDTERRHKWKILSALRAWSAKTLTTFQHFNHRRQEMSESVSIQITQSIFRKLDSWVIHCSIIKGKKKKKSPNPPLVCLEISLETWEVEISFISSLCDFALAWRFLKFEDSEQFIKLSDKLLTNVKKWPEILCKCVYVCVCVCVCVCLCLTPSQLGWFCTDVQRFISSSNHNLETHTRTHTHTHTQTKTVLHSHTLTRTWSWFCPHPSPKFPKYDLPAPPCRFLEESEKKWNGKIEVLKMMYCGNCFGNRWWIQE